MAARGINKVIVVGNLGNDPEIKYFPSGDAVTNLSVATSEAWKDKSTGEQQERTEWHRVTILGKLAEIASQYLRKGSKVYIEGKLKTRKWQAQDGQDRYTTEIVIDGFNGVMQMLDGASGQGQQPQQPQQAAPQQASQQHPQGQQQGAYQRSNQHPQRPQQASQQHPQGQQQGAYQQGQGFNSFDDDMPF